MLLIGISQNFVGQKNGAKNFLEKNKENINMKKQNKTIANLV